MKSYVLVYSDDDKYVYYLFKEREFKILEKRGNAKIRNKKDLGLVVLFSTLMTIISRESAMQRMSILMFWISFIGSIAIGCIWGMYGNKSKMNELLRAKTIDVTIRDIQLHAHKIEAVWDAIITMNIFCFFGILGLFMACYKHNILFQLVSCLLLIMYIYFIYYSHPIYTFKLVKFVRNSQ